MSLSLSNLQSPKGEASKTKRRLGRGNASTKGTYSGRGLKGQKARSGGKGGLKIKGLRRRLLSIPKLRGFKSSKKKLATVNLEQLEKRFNADAIVTAKSLTKAGLIDTPKYGVKILGNGTLSKKLTVKGVKTSESAKAAIEKAGGSIS